VAGCGRKRQQRAGRAIIPVTAFRDVCCGLRVPGGAAAAVGCDQATPDTVLADVPVPQQQCPAPRAYKATSADGGRGGWLVAGAGWLGTDRGPLAGMKAAASTAGIPGDLGPHG
jgi:hypothetical protein